MSVITDSIPWKVDLGVIARRLALNFECEPSDRLGYELERDLFLAAYIFRRLHESGKLRSTTSASALTVEEYPATGKPVDIMSLSEPEECFDFTKGQAKQVAVLHLCNQLIHSQALWLGWQVSEQFEDEHFLVASDRQSYHGIYAIRMSDFLGVLETACEEDANSKTWRRDSTGRLRVVQSD